VIRHPFDQYRQGENRLTHALATALARESGLAGAFATDFLGRSPRLPAPLVAEQAMPGEPAPSEEEAERRGIPDLWLYDPEGRWCAVIECKINAPLTGDQLSRHLRMAKRCGFEAVTVAAITASPVRISLPTEIVCLRWDRVYVWLRERGGAWSTLAAEYFEVLEAKMIEDERLQEGALTSFDGIRFGASHPYNYVEAKRLLRLALAELRRDKKLLQATGFLEAPGRSAITGSDSRYVWDFLRLAEGDHTKTAHLTLGIHDTHAHASITVPNGISRVAHGRLAELGPDGWERLIKDVLERFAPLFELEPETQPVMKIVQRHYRSQRSEPHLDAMLDADLRTFLGGGRVKKVPDWVRLAFEVVVSKNRGTKPNVQLQVGAHFNYSRCPAMRSRHAIDLFSLAWRASVPLLNILLDRSPEFRS